MIRGFAMNMIILMPQGRLLRRFVTKEVLTQLEQYRTSEIHEGLQVSGWRKALAVGRRWISGGQLASTE